MKQIDFPKIKYKYVKYFNLVFAHKPKFGLSQVFLRLPVPISFIVPLISSRFSQSFYFGYLLRFIFFLAAVKS